MAPCSCSSCGSSCAGSCSSCSCGSCSVCFETPVEMGWKQTSPARNSFSPKNR
ncbi:hypothetical protein LX32DRAFT_643659 [Colletotrichum zoysiae]|uniref:Metallothionein n=1 Tax=Colletotrichum zoysiae TaxID=1216348 RepID=A0AAD9LZX1_9PEZI|nr:hypothetical protein LX32DRAFT_643659 [Colletotrichum zoysiae]